MLLGLPVVLHFEIGTAKKQTGRIGEFSVRTEFDGLLKPLHCVIVIRLLEVHQSQPISNFRRHLPCQPRTRSLVGRRGLGEIAGLTVTLRKNEGALRFIRPALGQWRKLDKQRNGLGIGAKLELSIRAFVESPQLELICRTRCEQTGGSFCYLFPILLFEP